MHEWMDGQVDGWVKWIGLMNGWLTGECIDRWTGCSVSGRAETDRERNQR